MRRWLLATAVGLCLAGAVGAGESKKGCAGHGTTVDFYSTPTVAAKAAKVEEKLVFVLHVSGHFEDPTFT
jgi:hypothetical protein